MADVWSVDDPNFWSKVPKDKAAGTTRPRPAPSRKLLRRTKADLCDLYDRHASATPQCRMTVRTCLATRP